MARIIEIEDKLAKGVSAGRVKHELVQLYGITPRHARRLVKVAELRWKAEADAKDRESRRAHLYQAAWLTFKTALERKGMSLDREGGEHYFANPDAGAMARVLDFIARLGGDLEQPDKQGGDINVNLIQVLQQHYGMTPEAVQLAEASRVTRTLPSGGDDET